MVFREKFTAFLVVFVLILGGCADNLTAPEHIEKAQQYLGGGELKSAEIELKNALKKMPNSPEARFMLGKLYAEMGNGPGAEKELEKALELGVAKLSLLNPYATALLQQRKYRKLLDETVEFDSLSEPQRAELYVHRGDAYLGTGQFEQANGEYEQALEVSPGLVLAVLGKVKVAHRKGDDDRVQTLIKQLIKDAPNNPLVWRFQGDLHSKKQRPEKAIESYTKAIELDGGDYLSLANRALLYVDTGKSAEANTDIERLLKDASHYFMAHFASGRYRYSQQDFAGAQTAFQESLKLYEDYAPTYLHLGLSQLMLSQLNQAEQNLGTYLSRSPGSVAAHNALASVQFRQGRFDIAKSTLAPVLRHFPDLPFANRLMARIEFGLGNSAAGIEYLERLVQIAPDEAQAHASLGMARLLANQGESGAESLELALQLDPAQERTRELVAFSYIQQKNYEKAQKVIADIRKQYPQNPASWNLEGVMYWNQQQFAEARRSFETALEKQPGMPGASHYLAQLLLRDKKFDDAKKIYGKVLENHPDHYATQVKLAQLDAQTENLTATYDRLNRVIETHPRLLEPRLLLAGYYLRFGGAEQALSLLANIDPALTNPSFLALLIEAELKDQQNLAALESAQKLLSVAPQSAYAHFLSAKVYQANRDLEKLRGALNKTLDLDPQYKPAMLSLVRLLALEGSTKDAADQVQQLLKQHPNDHEVLSLAGWFAFASGNAVEAEQHYKASLELYPSTATVLELAKAQMAQENTAEGLKTLEQWNNRYPKDVLVRYARSAFHQQLDQKALAVQRLEEILEQQPGYPLALNDLAWLIREQNPKRALELVTKASEALPGAAGIQSSRAVILADNARYSEALRASERLLQRFPGNQNYRYYHALILYKKGDPLQAQRLLEQLLGEGQRFSEYANAEHLLQKIRR